MQRRRPRATRGRGLLRVLMITPEAYGGYGGIAQLSGDLASGLASAPEVGKLLLLARHRGSVPASPPAGVRLSTLSMRGKAGFLLAILGALLGPRPDLVVCTHIHLLPFAALAKRRWRARLLLVVHGVEIWKRPRRPGLDWGLKAVDWVFAVSAYSKSKLLAWAPLEERRVLVQPCCVDLSAFRPGGKDEELLRRFGLEGKRVLLVVARLAGNQRSKGVDQVLEVLPELAAEMPELVFAVAGKGDDRARLEAKAEALGIADHVRFLGYVAEADKPALYRSAEAFVLASRGEGFGIVLLEAAASGLPLIGSSLDASQEVVAALGSGEIVDPDDLENLKAGIQAALAAPRGTRPKALETYGRPAFEARIHAFLRENFDAGAGR